MKNYTVFINQLKKQLREELPGQAAQYRMAHAVRRSYAPPPPDVREACTLALFYPKNGEGHLVLMQRQSNNPNDRHGGQISFPGGKLEETDESLAAAALREAQEEVGIIPEDVELLGQLTDLFIPVSNFLVHPFVGYLDYAPVFKPQVSEVKAIIEVPFSHLANLETIKVLDVKFSKNIKLQNVPYFDVEGHIVWGATAMMLSELLEIAGFRTEVLAG